MKKNDVKNNSGVTATLLAVLVGVKTVIPLEDQVGIATTMICRGTSAFFYLQVPYNK
ncbi:hypothetical protein HMPREF0083_03057 [Aneurinibacillus aneurinilyticus ATCC 12856]|uniref:Uncharacterized protein n=1 Tax=Aneurinibacillus aneurinilyticus ATCC 12856 TaxID=649747 RepID=U1X1L7_ANEAE|nr:hypothetical protein HMPREF0083_03057 [Aneurinibacillus aneurinilyticus ATCC 12856]